MQHHVIYWRTGSARATSTSMSSERWSAARDGARPTSDPWTDAVAAWPGTAIGTGGRRRRLWRMWAARRR